MTESCKERPLELHQVNLSDKPDSFALRFELKIVDFVAHFVGLLGVNDLNACIKFFRVRIGKSS